MEAVLLTGPPMSKPMQAPMTAPMTALEPPLRDLIQFWNASMMKARGWQNTHRNSMPHTNVVSTGMMSTGMRPLIHFGTFQVFIQRMK